MRTVLKTAFAVALAALALSGGTALAQAAPLAGAIALSLVPSTLAPPANANFTVDLNIDMTAATATCTTGGATVPMTLGAYVLGLTYDNTKLQYVSGAACPTGPAEFSAAPTCNDLGTEVRCNNVNSGNTTAPTGSVCALRVTFKNIGATTGSPTSLVTVHQPSPRSISTNLVLSPTNCGGPATFPAGSITDATIPAITPASITLFAAE